MTIEDIRDYCLSKPDAKETLPFGLDTLVFKVDNIPPATIFPHQSALTSECMPTNDIK